LPLYDFTCVRSHRTELVRPIGTEWIDCPVCGLTASRSHVHRFDVVGPTVDSRGLYRRFSEASDEIGYATSKLEATLERPVQGPQLWQRTKARVKEMQRVGEARYQPRKE
jgi:hypothetical protein